MDELKKDSYPSRNGLYVSEILLLEYCLYHAYPNPKSGYPGFWWFKYGIRDVHMILKLLENQGFLYLLPNGKYDVTQLGMIEIKENAYVKYMHIHNKWTDFTAWDVNRMLHDTHTPTQNYMDIIIEFENKREKETEEYNRKFYESLQQENPEVYKKRKLLKG